MQDSKPNRAMLEAAMDTSSGIDETSTSPPAEPPAEGPAAAPAAQKRRSSADDWEQGRPSRPRRDPPEDCSSPHHRRPPRTGSALPVPAAHGGRARPFTLKVEDDDEIALVDYKDEDEVPVVHLDDEDLPTGRQRRARADHRAPRTRPEHRPPPAAPPHEGGVHPYVMKLDDDDEVPVVKLEDDHEVEETKDEDEVKVVEDDVRDGSKCETERPSTGRGQGRGKGHPRGRKYRGRGWSRGQAGGGDQWQYPGWTSRGRPWARGGAGPWPDWPPADAAPPVAHTVLLLGADSHLDRTRFPCCRPTAFQWGALRVGFRLVYPPPADGWPAKRWDRLDTALHRAGRQPDRQLAPGFIVISAGHGAVLALSGALRPDCDRHAVHVLQRARRLLAAARDTLPGVRAVVLGPVPQRRVDADARATVHRLAGDLWALAREEGAHFIDAHALLLAAAGDGAEPPPEPDEPWVSGRCPGRPPPPPASAPLAHDVWLPDGFHLLPEMAALLWRETERVVFDCCEML